MTYYRRRTYKLTHAQSQQIHTVRRAKERVGLNLSPADVKKIARKIRNMETTPIRKLTNARTLHSVEYKGKRLRVIYDKRTKVIATIIGEDNGTDRSSGD